MFDKLSNLPEDDQFILNEIRFSYLDSYKAAGMSEPWSMKIDRTLVLLHKVGIGAIMTLTEEDMYGKEYEAAGFFYHHEPINDCEAPNRKEMDRAVNFIDTYINKGMGVVVHCLEGRGRTGLVLCAWLGKREALCAERAIEKINRLREWTVLTEAQQIFLNEYLKN